MEQDTLKGYHKEARLINLYTANIFSLFLFIPVILIYGFPFYLIWGDGDFIGMIKNDLDSDSINSAITVLFVVIIGIVIHELIHGITWSFFTKKGFKSIKFGVLPKMFTPYCHCKEPLTTRQYILGAIMPFIILGFLPAIVSLVMGNLSLMMLAVFFTVAAAGDLMIIRMMLKEKRDSLVFDHPSEAGYYVFVKDEVL